MMLWRVVVQKDDEEKTVLQRRLSLDEARAVRASSTIPTGRVWIEPDREVA